MFSIPLNISYPFEWMGKHVVITQIESGSGCDPRTNINLELHNFLLIRQKQNKEEVKGKAK